MLNPKIDPIWRTQIGMPQSAAVAPPAERNTYLRRLQDLVENHMRQSVRSEGDDPESEALRSPIWTPIPYICHALEISHACLSRMLRELTGLNAIQTYYALRLTETQVPLRYIALIKEYVAETLAPLPYSGNGSRDFWKWLKQKHKNLDFDRQLLAKEFGFPNDARFHRALYFVTGSTPREFENLIIRLATENNAEFETLIQKYSSSDKPAVEAEEVVIVQNIPPQDLKRRNDSDQEVEIEARPTRPIELTAIDAQNERQTFSNPVMLEVAS